METACQRLQEAHVLSYRDLKNELEALARPVQCNHPAPVHENIRGENYYH